jgi:hypothetical protein
MQTNIDLWLDRTLRIGACGTWWAAGTPGGQTLGTLQLDPELVAQPAVRDRVAAAVAAVRAANPSGVLRTTELVYDARRAWLVVATLPKPTLADLLDARGSLPSGAASGLAVDIAAALRELHAAGLSHGDLCPGTVVLTGAGYATLAEAGVLAAVRDAPTDVGRDAAAWAGMARDLATRSAEPETSLLLDSAAIAERGDLTAAARILALRAEPLPDFGSREQLCALLPSIEPSTAAVPAQRDTSTVDSGPWVRLRLGPGVPDPALLHPRPLEIVPARRGRLRQVLAWVGLAAVLVLGGAGAAWWFLLR